MRTRSSAVIAGGEQQRGEHGRVPSAEVLGARVLARQILEVVVHVGSTYLVPIIAVAEDEELRSSSTPAKQARYRANDVIVGHNLGDPDAALPLEVEPGFVGTHRDMALPQRRKPEGTVLVQVFLVPMRNRPSSSKATAHARTRSRHRSDRLRSCRYACRTRGNRSANPSMRANLVASRAALHLG